MKRQTVPVRVALVDDYDVVVIGLAHLFDAYVPRQCFGIPVINESTTPDER